MAATKTETVTFRIAPEVEAALREAAAREHRSLASMLGVVLREYACGSEEWANRSFNPAGNRLS